MTIHSLQALVDLAREKSPFYRQLYANLPRTVSLTSLPLIDQVNFWKANTIENNQLLTGPIQDGIVFKSGGTTGNPKFSVFSKDEWKTFTDAFGKGMAQGALARARRVANIFYGGELYASFLFILESIHSSGTSVLQFPLAGNAPVPSVLKTLCDFQIDTLAGVPTSILNLADEYERHPKRYSPIALERILFGGESMYPDQRTRLLRIFPGIEISSVGCASVDGGLIGYADDTCEPDEHRTFGAHTTLEIVDDANRPIVECNQPGRIILTNLTRTLMPILRYPAGDRAIWVEPENKKDRKFKILGRSEEAARIGPVSLYYEDMRSFLEQHIPDVLQFQLIIQHEGLKDRLLLRLATRSGRLEAGPSSLEERFCEERPLFREAVEKSQIHPLQVQIVGLIQLETNPRTGKLRRVIDLRKE